MSKQVKSKQVKKSSKIASRVARLRSAIAVSLANAKRAKRAKFAKASLRRAERLREMLKRATTTAKAAA